MNPLVMQTATPTPTPGQGGGGGITINFPTIDWSTLIPDVVPLFFTSITSTIAKAGQSALGALTDAGNGLNVLTQTQLRWTVDYDLVHQIADAEVFGTQVRIALVAVMLVWVGYQVLFGHEDLWEGTIRVGFAILLSQSVFWWGGLLIGLINALAAGVTSIPLNVASLSIPNTLELAILLIVAIYFGVRAWIKGAVGTVFIAALLACSPFVLLLIGSRLTSRWAHWWFNHFVPWVIRPLPVALAIRFGLGIASSVGESHVQFLFAIAAFWLCDKLPEWLMSSSLSANGWAGLAQLAILQRVAGFAAAATGVGGAAVRAGAGAIGGAAHAGAAGAGAAAWEAGQLGRMGASGAAHAASAYNSHLHS